MTVQILTALALARSGPLGTFLERPISSDAEESSSAFLRETMLATHRTQEWVQAQQRDSSPGISRRLGVTFEESPILYVLTLQLLQERVRR